MTKELREPPLLSDDVITQTIIDATIRTTAPKSAWRAMCQAQREADIKWMKENCYLRAEGKLPQNPYTAPYLEPRAENQKIADLVYCKARQDMLKEVDGVSFKAVRKWD